MRRGAHIRLEAHRVAKGSKVVFGRRTYDRWIRTGHPPKFFTVRDAERLIVDRFALPELLVGRQPQ